jgi:pimeloyl-ACP methyl ester carboxylesterase
MKRALAALGLAVILAACGTASSARTPVSSGAPATRAPVNVLAAPTRIARTAAGPVGYREVGAGSPLLLITGFGASMDDWPPSFVDTLADHHEVIVFDNAGVGQTAPAASSSITAMADARLLAGSVPGARLILYPDAGHAFLFQDASSFIPAVERFLG